MDNHQQPSEERQVRVSQHKAQQAHQQVLAPPLHRAPPQAQHPLAPPQAHHPLLLPLLQNPFFHFPSHHHGYQNNTNHRNSSFKQYCSSHTVLDRSTYRVSQHHIQIFYFLIIEILLTNTNSIHKNRTNNSLLYQNSKWNSNTRDQNTIHNPFTTQSTLIRQLAPQVLNQHQYLICGLRTLLLRQPCRCPAHQQRIPQDQQECILTTRVSCWYFTAVGIVVVGIVGAMLYCCCCFGGAGGRHNDHDGYSDEENQYSSDELSVNHATVVAPYSKQSSFSTLKRDSSSKTLFAYFTGDNTNKESGVNRSSSRRKLMSRRSSQMSSSPNNNPEADGGAMFPINEIDSRLDPDTMFLNQNFSNKSLGDNQDYSRKLKITNPE